MKVYILDISVNATLMFCSAVVSNVRNVLRLVIVDRNVILRYVLRRRCDSFCIRGPWNVNVTRMFCVVLWVLRISGDDVLWNIRVFSFVTNDSRNPFVLLMCSIVLHSFWLLLGDKNNRCFLVKRNRKAVLWSIVWLEVKWINIRVSMDVGFM